MQLSRAVPKDLIWIHRTRQNRPFEVNYRVGDTRRYMYLPEGSSSMFLQKTFVKSVRTVYAAVGNAESKAAVVSAASGGQFSGGQRSGGGGDSSSGGGGGGGGSGDSGRRPSPS